MVLAVFTETPIHPYAWEIRRPTIVAKMSGGGEQRASLLSRHLRVYRLGFHCREGKRATIDAFFEARGFELESFLWRDLKDNTRAGVNPGHVGDGVNKTLGLPTTGPHGGEYPEAPFQLYAAGAPVAGTLDTDNRLFTYTVAPAVAAVLTVDYAYLRRVKLARAYSWREDTFGIFRTEIELEEVVGDG